MTEDFEIDTSGRHSASELACYLDCRAKHHLRYRMAVVQSSEVEELILGTAVHNAMETLCVQLKIGNTLERTMPVALQQLEDELAYSMPSVRIRATSALWAGYDFLMSHNWQIVAVESAIDLNIDGWQIPGRLDLLARDEYGVLHLIDWKTERNTSSSTVGQVDLQTCIYAADTFRLFPDETTITAGRVYLRAAEPEIELTKAGKVSLTSTASWRDYQEFVAKEPDAAVDSVKAQEKFRTWYRADLSPVTPDMVRRVLETGAKIAREIDNHLEPLPNWRPKFCVRCEQRDACKEMFGL
jgi:ATP-dependent helicase/DNAse subunit B